MSQAACLNRHRSSEICAHLHLFSLLVQLRDLLAMRAKEAFRNALWRLLLPCAGYITQVSFPGTYSPVIVAICARRVDCWPDRSQVLCPHSVSVDCSYVLPEACFSPRLICVAVLGLLALCIGRLVPALAAFSVPVDVRHLC